MITWLRTAIVLRSLRNWVRSNPTYIFLGKISYHQNGQLYRYKVTAAHSRTDFLTAENFAHDVVDKWLASRSEEFDDEPIIKWRRGYMLTTSMLDGEPASSLQLMERLRLERIDKASIIEPIESSAELVKQD